MFEGQKVHNMAETPKSILVIVNLQAARAPNSIPALEDALIGLNMQFTLVTPDTEEEARSLLAVKVCDHDLIVVGGGDGTLHNLLPELLKYDKPVAILPFGAVNDFSRSVGIPEDWHDALGIIAAGQEQLIDVGMVDGRPFLSAVNLGLGERIARQETGYLKRFLGGAAYLFGWKKAMDRHEPFAADVTIDEDERSKFKADHVTVSNTPSIGRHFSTDASNEVDSGKLSVTAVKPKSAWQWLLILPRLFRGNPEEVAGVATAETTKVTIETRPQQAYSVDGETVGRTPVEVEVKPQRLRVLTPP